MRDGKGSRQVGNETTHDRLDLAPENGMHRATHAGVADEGRAVLENLFVRRLDMGVGAEHGGNAAVEITADRNFLTRGFAMRIDDDTGRLGAHFVHRRVQNRKRIFQNRLHEGARLDVDHAHFSFRCLEHDAACPRRARRII